jgi:hypothetical protein
MRMTLKLPDPLFAHRKARAAREKGAFAEVL